MKCRADIILTIGRWLLGALFLFSGFVKSVDTVGTSIYVEKYLVTYSAEWLMPASVVLAVVLGVVEMALGVMLILRIAPRKVAATTTLVLLFFTTLTLLSATLLPLGECGCFGDAVKLTPWGTVLKNVVALAVAVVLWRRSAPQPLCRRDVVVTTVALLIPLIINIYVLRHLPLIDFLPYKVSTALRDEIVAERQRADEGGELLVCRHPESGEIREFDARGDEWYDWDVVDVRSVAPPTEDMLYADFRLYNKFGEECSEELLMREGVVAWLCIHDVEQLDNDHFAAIERLKSHYPAERIVVLTSDGVEALNQRVGFECYSVDAMTLRSMMRAEVGVIILDDGVIVDKRAYGDI